MKSKLGKKQKQQQKKHVKTVVTKLIAKKDNLKYDFVTRTLNQLFLLQLINI